jgi:hypothetical protein
LPGRVAENLEADDGCEAVDAEELGDDNREETEVLQKRRWRWVNKWRRRGKDGTHERKIGPVKPKRTEKARMVG